MREIDFENFKWVHPYKDNNSIVDLLNVIYKKAQSTMLNENFKTNELEKLVPDHEKLIFILVDGMGYHLLKTLLPDSFLANNIKTSINTVFPSSTGTVLTTLATNKCPEEHGINGWFSYIEEKDKSILTIPLLERFKLQKPEGVLFHSVFSHPSVLKSIPIDVNVVYNEKINGSEFSTWASGERNTIAVKDIEGAFPVLEEIVNKEGKSFNYVYFSEFDASCHKYGVHSKEAKDVLELVNRCVEDFYLNNKGKFTMVMIADHGLIDVAHENNFIVYPEDKMNQFFYAPPAGDARVSSFYVKSDMEQNFVEEFENRFGDRAVILSIEEVEKLQLLGVNQISEVSKKRFGNYIAIWKAGYSLEYHEKQPEKDKLNIGMHGGLTKEEVEIPVIVLS